MKTTFDSYDGDAVVTFNETPELKEAVYQKVLAFFKEHDSYSGECIHQSDDPQIEAPSLLADIADDLFKFQLKFKNE